MDDQLKKKWDLHTSKMEDLDTLCKVVQNYISSGLQYTDWKELIELVGRNMDLPPGKVQRRGGGIISFTPGLSLRNYRLLKALFNNPLASERFLICTRDFEYNYMLPDVSRAIVKYGMNVKKIEYIDGRVEENP